MCYFPLRIKWAAMCISNIRRKPAHKVERGHPTFLPGTLLGTLCARAHTPSGHESAGSCRERPILHFPVIVKFSFITVCDENTVLVCQFPFD